MKALAGILEEYVGPGPEVVFGRRTDVPPAVQSEAGSDDRLDRLTRRLDAQVVFNNRLILVIVAAYVAILVIFSFLALVNRHNLASLAAFLGGNLLALAAVGSKLHDLWREKNYMDALLGILPSLPSPEALKALQSFYAARVNPAGEAERRA